MKAKTEKKFDAAKMAREIKDKLDAKLSKMNTLRSSNTSHASIRDPCYLWSQFPVGLVNAPAPY